MSVFDMPAAAIYGQVFLGVINGAFYAMLSLGLAIIFGVLRIVHFAQGAFYMVGAFLAWLLAQNAGLGFWYALVIVPVVVAIAGMIIERTLLRRIRDLDHLYGLLLTLGLAMAVQAVIQLGYGTGGRPYPVPSSLEGLVDLGFMHLPLYRLAVLCASVAICCITWLLIERTFIGAKLRAATENPVLSEILGLNVPALITVVYGFGVGLAALAGVLAAPIYSVRPGMGGDLLIVTFAVVVIGGMGSIGGAVVAGFGIGLIEGLTKVIWPEASGVMVFVVMALVLLAKPAGLFGRAA